MKNLITYPLFESSEELTREQRRYLDDSIDGRWEIDKKTGLVDVYGDFESYESPLDNLPVSFGSIEGNFNISSTGLKTLKGCPIYVARNFLCENNFLESLEGAPGVIDGSFSCSHNNIKDLKGCPKEVGVDFDCSNNLITSLDGCQERIEGTFDCSVNKLSNLKGGPMVTIWDYSCYNNPLNSLDGAPFKVGGYFHCDAFQLWPSNWDIDGWKEILDLPGMVGKKKTIIESIFSKENLENWIKFNEQDFADLFSNVWYESWFSKYKKDLNYPNWFDTYLRSKNRFI